MTEIREAEDWLIMGPSVVASMVNPLTGTVVRLIPPAAVPRQPDFDRLYERFCDWCKGNWEFGHQDPEEVRLWDTWRPITRPDPSRPVNWEDASCPT